MDVKNINRMAARYCAVIIDERGDRVFYYRGARYNVNELLTGSLFNQGITLEDVEEDDAGRVVIKLRG